MKPIGSNSLEIEKIEKILKLTDEGSSRREIAEEVECGKTTVYRYQKKFDRI